MKKFSFLVPTRNRPDLVARFFQSIVDTTSDVKGLEVVLCFDDDDTESQKIKDGVLDIKRVVIKKGATMGTLNRACFDVSSGRYVMLLNDDVILRTKNWDEIIFSVFSSYEDDIVLIHINDLLFREKLCTFPMLSRKACLEIGICPPEYQRYRIDNHIYDIYNMLAYIGHNRIVYLPDVIFEHDNYAHGQKGHIGQVFKSDDNKVYIPDQKIIKSDALIFESKQEERKQKALKLASLIDKSEYSRKQSIYTVLLNNIKDPFSYRRGDFVRKIGRGEDGLKKSATVTVAVVTADIRKEHPKKCLSLLKKHTSNFELVILDNNSSKNFNHPMEMNKMLQIAKTDYLVLMDDDVFVEEGWLDGLIKCIDGETGVVTPLHKDRNGRLSYSGAYLLGDNTGRHTHHLDKPDKPRETQAVCSACILIDIRKCGHLRFNTAYKKYFLDIDFAIQVWESGYKVMVTPESIVTHLGGATMPWSSERAYTLCRRDEDIFIEIWIKSGRIKKVINGIWSRIPFIQHITELPKIIDDALKDIPNQNFDQFKCKIENLIAMIKPLKLFHHKIVQKIERQILLCESNGDKISVHFCNKAISQLTDTSLAYRKFLMIVKRLLTSLATLILSKPWFAAPMHNVLKKIFDCYLRSPLFVRKTTDRFILNIDAIFVSVKDAQKEKQISINSISCEPLNSNNLPNKTKKQ